MPETGGKTVYKSLGLCGFGLGSNSAAVDVKDGKILRIRPMHYDEKYEYESMRPWKITARNGAVLEPKTRTLPTPLQYAYKKRVYSKNRVPYPLKRVDWDPNGERHPETRGEAKYVRISWDEATDIIASELKRIYGEYGPFAVLAQIDGHGESKIIHAAHGCPGKLLDLLGGYTLQARQPDSWEGWTWGAKHIWGMDPVGKQAHTENLFKDIAENGDCVIMWSGDPETTPWGWGGMMPGRVESFFTEAGIKQIFITPDLNYAAAAHADKWIPVLPNTDAALQCAIAYVWMKEGLYDRAWVESHSVGFDWFERYILGGEDGVAKTPAWAAPITGVSARQIKALARYWAKHAVSIGHCAGGGLIRAAYSSEPARLEVCLLTMQQLGKPGAGQINFMDVGLFGIDDIYPFPRCELQPDMNSVYHGWAMLTEPVNFIPKTLIPQAIMNPPVHWSGGHVIAGMPAQDQFIEWDFPQPGAGEIHMIWTDSPCWQTCWNGGNEMQRALRHPNLQFIVAQHPWLENDALFADIILPTTTKLEVNDISADLFSGQYNMILHEEQAVPHVGESLSDWEAVGEVAKKLGLYEQYAEGTEEELIKKGFENSGCEKYLTYEEWMEKGYFVVPTAENWENDRLHMRPWYEDPDSEPLSTPTGKVEFYSTALAEHYPDDVERPPVPHFVPYGESHTESLLHPRAKEYPFLLITNHPRWRVHANNDDNTWMREFETCKVKGPDGYMYEPIWVNPLDAGRLNLHDGDICKIFNERGAVLGGVRLSERVIPGALYQDHGARVDSIVIGEFDRGGANNLICPSNTTSKNCPGEVTNSFLINIAKVDVFELAKQYPVEFAKFYDKDTGHVAESCIIEEGR
ncbi:molybdopterin-dependent oxidoreductase [Raoultibacter phocaeensis]|uniref:molybdopterin-dependent oxidoreductase n=1 Tax=Raoultibacter phocaeensis TaxID=2479841 RepID=UPI00111AA27A|nr:molybdopterin-dependent oxidoreductase [Raoultibacter phocaeensis]